MIFWQNDILAKWYCGKIRLWQNDILAKSYFGKMIFWQNHTLAKWYCGKTIFWQNHILGYTLAAFQTNTLFKANDFANWFTKWPQIEWQKNRQSKGLWSSPEKEQQEHHEANGPPRSPNYVLLSLILIYWYDCAVLLAAPRVVQDWLAFYHHGCRDAGTPPCMNMLWSHALPIQVFHVKTVQPSLNLRCFGHENHVSWSFYRFMLRDKRHCSQVLWFEAGSTTAKQTQLS